MNKCSRRDCFVWWTALATNNNNKTTRVVPVNNNNKVSPNQVYFFETDRFRSMYMVVADEKESSFLVKRRVDWYDPFTDTTKSDLDATMYITDVENSEHT